VGVFATQILTLFAFIEYTWFSIFGSLITILINVLILKSNPDRISYLIYSIYSAICCIRGAVTVYKIHKKQNTCDNILLIK